MRTTVAMTLVVTLLTTSTLRAQQQEEEEGNNSLEQSTEESTEQTTEDTSESTTEPTNDSGAATQELIDTTSSRDDEPEPQPTPTPDDRERERERLLVTGLAVLVVVLAVVAVLSWTRPRGPATSKHDAQALAWLEENREQLRIDLAIGQGPTIDDLAAVYRVPAERQARFAEALRSRRAELLDIASGADAAKARAFLRRVGEIMESDAVLHDDFVRWRMVAGVEAASPR